MNRLLVLICALMAILMTSSAWAQDRTVTIFFTHNASRDRKRHPADCLGSVTYEVLPTLPGQTVRWQIVNGTPANNPNEKCENFDAAQVSLRFKGRSPFADGKTEVSPENGSTVINETILKKEERRTFRYVVRYKGRNAGPDPDVDVDCGGCFPP